MQARDQEEVQSRLPGDKVIRIIQKRRLRPRLLSWRELIMVLKGVVFETPFFIMVPILVVLLLLFSAGLYWAENGAVGSNVNNYGEALWDGVVLMTTAGTMSEPVTVAGHMLGAIWTILGCMLFYGTIIASASAYFLLPISSYFLLPRRGEQAKLVGTIQYNFGRLDELSLMDLEALKSETANIIDAAIQQHKKPE
ncbi:two pore domain potassium channel family protein [Chloroflexota bacterium]